MGHLRDEALVRPGHRLAGRDSEGGQRTELFVRGQTGSSAGRQLHGEGPGRRAPEDAAAQADLALDQPCDTAAWRQGPAWMRSARSPSTSATHRAYRGAVYPVIGRHFRGIPPVSTGLIVAGQFAQSPKILFEIDAHVLRKAGRAHASAAAPIPFQRGALWVPRPAVTRLRLLHGGASRASR